MRATTKEQLRLTQSVRRMRMHVEGKYSYHEEDDAYRMDLEAIIKAYLAEHLPDADDAIDAEWLKAGGWEYFNDVWVICCDSLLPAFSLEYDADSPCCAGFIGEHENGESWPHDIWTRGQLRDICRALGAPLPN